MESEAPEPPANPPPLPPTRARLCGAPEWACPAPSAPAPVLMSPLWEWPFVAGSGHAACARGSQKTRFTSPGAPGVDNRSLPPCPFAFFSVFSVFLGNAHTPHFCMGQKIKPQVSLFLCTFQPRRGQVPSPSCGTSLHQCPPPLVSGSLLAPFPCKQAHVSRSKTINKIFPLLFPAPLPPSAAHFSREHPRPSPPSHPPLLGPWQPWVPGKAAPGWPIGFSSS